MKLQKFRFLKKIMKSLSPDLKKVDDALNVDMSLIGSSTVNLIREKRENLKELTEENEKIQEKIKEVEGKYRNEFSKIEFEKSALLKQIERRKNEHSKELNLLKEELDAKYEELRDKQNKEIELSHTDLLAALQETEDFYAKNAGEGDFNDKKYRFKRGQILIEEYGNIVETLDEAITQLATSQDLQIIKAGKEIEETSGKVFEQAKDSSDTNKRFREEIAKREKEHLAKMDQLTKKFAKERGKVEAEAEKELEEVQNMIDMYTNINQHNVEQLQSIEEEIERLQKLVPETSSDKSSTTTNSLITQLSAIESEINELRSNNSKLREEISKSDSYSRTKSYLD